MGEVVSMDAYRLKRTQKLLERQFGSLISNCYLAAVQHENECLMRILSRMLGARIFDPTKPEDDSEL